MKKREVASNLRVAGIGALAVSIILYLNDDLYFLGYTFDVVGTGLFIASLPVGSVGKNQIIVTIFITMLLNIRNHQFQ